MANDHKGRGAVINDADIERFHAEGFMLCPGFYDVESEIRPIQEGVRMIIELVARKYGVDARYSTWEEAMAFGYPAIIKGDRARGGEIYDAIKQIPEFISLVGSARNAKFFEAIRKGSKAGVAAGGYGIRIDNPQEEKFRAWWHQDFPAQLRSLDGVVFWAPLLAVTPEMGPVQIAIGSHRDGLVPVYDDDAGLGRAGAYALRMEQEAERVARYRLAAPTTKPGDLIILDYLVLHQSGYNVSKSPRWTMQMRYFNFADPLGIRIGWKGSFAAGVKFQDVMPELTSKQG
jgi:hypothetical protein